MSVSQPPVLKKVQKPTDQQSLEMLKSIDSRLEEMSILKPEVVVVEKKIQHNEYGKTHKKSDKVVQEKVKTTGKASNSTKPDKASTKKVDRRSDYGKTHKKSDKSAPKKAKVVDKTTVKASNSTKPDNPSIKKVDRRSDYGKTHKKSDKVVQEKVKVVDKTTVKKKTKDLPFYKKIINSISEFNQKIADKMNGVIEQDEISRDKGNENLKEGITELSKSTIQGLLGPLNLVLSPLSETFGIKFEDLFKNDYKEKGKKIKPKRADVVKSNPEIAWAVDQLGGKGSNKKGQNEEDSLINKLFGGAMSGGIAGVAKQLFPALIKAAPFAAIAGGLVWAVIDGLNTAGKAEKWGVDKAQAFLGGFFSGQGEGWKNVVANAGKWGLTGLGVGTLVGGPIGAIAGLLVGAALGAVFGWIGAENTSQGLRDLGYQLGIGTKDSEASAALEEAKAKKEQIISLMGEFVNTKTKTGEKALTSLKAGLESRPGENEFVKGQEQAIILNEIQKRRLAGANASDKERVKLKQEIDNLENMFFELKEKKEKGRWSTNIVELQKKYKIDFPTFENDKKVERVNDAIITPAGRIITPSPDDTIIATKSKVTQGFDSESMSNELSNLYRKTEANSRIEDVLSAIRDLISVVKEKPFNNVVQSNTNQSFDFDKLRAVVG